MATLLEPGDITAVYSSIIEKNNNWLLLHYVDDSHHEIGLHSFGNEGLEELKNKIDDLDKVFIGFYQEEYEYDPGYVIINYIPPSTSGVKRASVLVHSRRVGTIFKKHEAVFTTDNLSLLTSDNIHHAITKKDNSTSLASSGDTNPEFIEEAGDLPTIPDSGSLDELPMFPVRSPRPFIENPMIGRASSSSSPPRPHSPFGRKSFFGNLLKRKKKTKSLENLHEEAPPIPPKSLPALPKDKATYYPSQSMGPTLSQIPQRPPRISQEGGGLLRHRRSRSMSDFAVISHVDDDFGNGSVAEPEPTHPPPQPVPLKGKWAPLPMIPNDPAERSRRRRELQLKREREEQEAKEEEMKRQERIKIEKVALFRQEADEDKRRKEEVEKEIRRVRRREIMEREREEAKQREFEERKFLNRDRRKEEHRKLEQWRDEQARKAEAAARQAEEVKKREEMDRMKRIQEAAAKVKAVKEESELSGWFTMLNEEGLAWKRRYYRFVGSNIFLYRDKKDMTTPLEQLDLKGNVKALKEWNEGYEALEAIQFSFVVEFRQCSSWSLYADSEEAKFKLLGLFKVAGGL